MSLVMSSFNVKCLSLVLMFCSHIKSPINSLFFINGIQYLYAKVQINNIIAEIYRLPQSKGLIK